jgi:hypothetical protein
VFFIRLDFNSTSRTVLGAQSAADTIVRHYVFYQRLALSRRATFIYVSLIFRSKVSYGGKNRIRRGFTEAAKAPSLDHYRKVLQLINIGALTLSCT